MDKKNNEVIHAHHTEEERNEQEEEGSKNKKVGENNLNLARNGKKSKISTTTQLTSNEIKLEYPSEHYQGEFIEATSLKTSLNESEECRLKKENILTKTMPITVNIIDEQIKVTKASARA